jgi:RNA exonuclease 1
MLLSGIRPKSQDPAPGSNSVSLPSSDATPPEISLSELKVLLTELDERLTKIHDALPSRTALIIFTGHSDPRRMVQLNARKTAFETALKSGKAPESISSEIRWTTEDAREMEGAVTRAKRGLLFLGVK